MTKRLAAALALGASVTALVLVVGVADLENYEVSFFSLERGSALTFVKAFGHPVYSMDVALGVRFPLHGSLGASPAAALAPYFAAPVTYAVLLLLAITAVTLLARLALEPLCGPRVSLLAIALMFYAPPLVEYTIFDDWPETALTYCVFVAAIIVPHALLALHSEERKHTLIRDASFTSVLFWSLLACSHPGYWPLLMIVIPISCLLVLIRQQYSWKARLTTVMLTGLLSVTAVAPHVPDVYRELQRAHEVPGGLYRDSAGPQGTLLTANLFPLGQVGPRLPYTNLILALGGVVAGVLRRPAGSWPFAVGAGVASMGLGAAASLWHPSTSDVVSSANWALRDPSIILAVLSAAAVIPTLGVRGRSMLPIVLLALGATQGIAYTTSLIASVERRPSWTHDLRSPVERLAERGLRLDTVIPGARVALWPGVSELMRSKRVYRTDFFDVGFRVVTVSTKQRTMRAVVAPNNRLFGQSTELTASLLCDRSVVGFLQLQFLLAPTDRICPPWVATGGPIDDTLSLAEIPADRRLYVAFMAADLSAPVPGLSPAQPLPARLTPLHDTSVTLDRRSITVQLGQQPMPAKAVAVLPVAYDEGWRSSSGTVTSVRGFLALQDLNSQQAVLDFQPDARMRLRAGAMAVAQILCVIGLFGVAAISPVRSDESRLSAPHLT